MNNGYLIVLLYSYVDLQIIHRLKERGYFECVPLVLKKVISYLSWMNIDLMFVGASDALKQLLVYQFEPCEIVRSDIDRYVERIRFSSAKIYFIYKLSTMMH